MEYITKNASALFMSHVDELFVALGSAYPPLSYIVGPYAYICTYTWN